MQLTAFLLVCIIDNCIWRADRDKRWTVRRKIGRIRVYVLFNLFSFFYVTNNIFLRISFAILDVFWIENGAYESFKS